MRLDSQALGRTMRSPNARLAMSPRTALSALGLTLALASAAGCSSAAEPLSRAANAPAAEPAAQESPRAPSPPGAAHANTPEAAAHANTETATHANTEAVAHAASDLTTLRVTFAAPCGRSLLELPDGTFVQPVGERSPTRLLGYDVLLGTPLAVTGELTGHTLDDDHCGAYPEFVVRSFEPAGPVRRVTSIGGLDGALHRYTAELPSDRFVPSDFEGYRGVVAMVDVDACAVGSACERPARAVIDGTGTAYCCAVYDLDLR